MSEISAEQAGDPRLPAFLDLVAWSEGTSTSSITRDRGYDVVVSGIYGPEIFSGYEDHPFADGRSPVLVRRVPLLTSTASGRYQLLLHWWDLYKSQLHLPDFSPLSQDLVALQQIKERGGRGLILSGDIAGAIHACSNIWASFPGNTYNQGGKTLDYLLQKYEAIVA